MITFLPINQSYGSFTQGGQYNLINNYNFGMYSGENGGGDYSLNIGKNFMLHKNLKLKTLDIDLYVVRLGEKIPIKWNVYSKKTQFS